MPSKKRKAAKELPDDWLKQAKKDDPYLRFRDRMLNLAGKEAPEPIARNSDFPNNVLIEKSITLYYTNPAKNSDKVYKIAIGKQNSAKLLHCLYHVYFAYGRRGSTLKQGEKTDSDKPVSLAVARLLFDQVVAEKISKEGYTENINGVA